MAFTRRWKGWTEKEVSARMRALAQKRVSAMSAKARKEHAKKMVDARGSWTEVDGKRVYTRSVK